MTPEEQIALLAEVREALPEVETWTEEPVPNPGGGPPARAYRGQGGGWSFLVIAFSVEDQGLPPGTMGFDGTASHLGRGIVLHLPRGLAEGAWKVAARGGEDG